MSETTKRPSEEKIWRKYYAEGAQRQLEEPLPEGSLWNGLLEPALRDKGDRYDAFVYFGNHISRSRLVETVELWARVLKGMGLDSDDQILVYSPVVPEALYVLFAANKVGITAIMPNLAASHDALEKSIDNAKAAFVLDDVEQNLTDILAKPQFSHVVILNAATSMSAPLKYVVGAMQRLKHRKMLKSSAKYLSVGQAIARYGGYGGSLEGSYRDDRVAMVFSSGGTTREGTAKLIGVTDKAMISMFRSALAFNLTDNPFREGTKALSLVPPFVCTGLFVLVFAPLYRGMTTYLDPRLDQKHFNEAVLRVRPQITLVSGRLWQGFFAEVEEKLNAGQNISLDNFVLPIMGGEGCTPEALEWMDGIALRAHSTLGLVSGYGMSEAFSVITIDYRPALLNKRDDKLAISVGYPFPGTTVGIFDEQGHELPYGQRGELWAKTPSMMKEYLNNPELTHEIIGDGWIHSGDLAEMTPDGLVYLYGRMHEHITAPNGERVYLFDISNRLRQDAAVRDALTTLVGDFSVPRIVAHLILDDGTHEPLAQILQRLDDNLRQWLPDGIEVSGYQTHKGFFAMSPITKIHRNYYSRILTGYCKPAGGTLRPVEFEK